MVLPPSVSRLPSSCRTVELSNCGLWTVDCGPSTVDCRKDVGTKRRRDFGHPTSAIRPFSGLPSPVSRHRPRTVRPVLAAWESSGRSSGETCPPRSRRSERSPGTTPPAQRRPPRRSAASATDPRRARDPSRRDGDAGGIDRRGHDDCGDDAVDLAVAHPVDREPQRLATGTDHPRPGEEPQARQEPEDRVRRGRQGRTRGRRGTPAFRSGPTAPRSRCAVG